MNIEQMIAELVGGNIVLLILAALIIIAILKAIRIVPQSEKYVVERFGKLRSVLGPGINVIVPFLDQVRHKVSVLERHLPRSEERRVGKEC